MTSNLAGNIITYGNGSIDYLCLHGWGGDHRTFEPLKPFIPKDVKLKCPDFPGCGGVPPPGEWTIDCIIEETGKVLQDCSIVQPPVVVGNCLGAVFALEMLYRNIISTQRLVIIDPLVFFPMYLKIFAMGKFGEGAYRASMETGVGRLTANLISRLNRSSKVDMTKSLKDIDHDSAYRYLRMMSDLPHPDRYSALNFSVDIIYGEETFRFARKSTKALKAIWGHAAEHLVPKASHLPILEETQFTAGLLFGATSESHNTFDSSEVKPATRSDNQPDACSIM